MEQPPEEILTEIMEALIKDVHFEKTYPAHTAYYQLEYNEFKDKLRQALIDQKKEILAGMPKIKIICEKCHTPINNCEQVEIKEHPTGGWVVTS